MNLRWPLRLAVVLGGLGLIWAGRQVVPPAPVQTRPPVPVGGAAAPGTAATHPEIGFRDSRYLSEHFEKHGREFGDVSRAQYLRLAQQLRDAPAGGDILQAVRQDGVVTRFDRQSGAFVAFDPDLTIRTFFRPNDGEAYFDRQLKRGYSLR